MLNPDFIPIAFAENGVKNPIQKQLQTGQDLESATWDKGWPQITMVPKEDGGLAPKGQDFNGVLNVLSQHAIHRQNGEQIKFSQDVVDQYNGYAMGAIVQSDDDLRHYRSLINNNTFNPNTQSIANRWQIYVGAGSVPIATSATAGITKVLNVLTSSDSGSALSAAQGRELKNQVDTKLNTAQALGVGQTWQNVTSSRASGATYTNNTGRPIQVALSVRDATGGAGDVAIVIGGVTVYDLLNISGGSSAVTFIVPDGQTYRVNVDNEIRRWAELR